MILNVQVIDVFPPKVQTPAQLRAAELAREAKALNISPEEKAAQDRDVKVVIVAVVCFWILMAILMLFIAWLFGARYDLAWKGLVQSAAEIRGKTEL